MAETIQSEPGLYLTFALRNQIYGVPIGVIREINRVSDITPVPQTPEYMAGVMNLRGKVIPVINLRLKFAMDFVNYNKETCIIIVDCPLGQMGAIVDSVSSVVALHPEQIEPKPEMGNDRQLSYITGMGRIENTVIILLDIVTALAEDSLAINQISNSATVSPLR